MSKQKAAPQQHLFSISRDALFNFVKTHNKNVEKNPTLPILGHLMLSFEGHELSVISDNLDVRMESKIKVNRGIDSEDAKILVDANFFYTILNSLNSQPLESILVSTKLPNSGGLGSLSSTQIYSSMSHVGVWNLRCKILIESQIPVVNVSR